MYKAVCICASLLMPMVACGKTLLIDGPESSLYLEDMEEVLLALPDDVRKNIHKDQTKLRKLVDQTYMAKVGASRAKMKGLDDDPVFQANINNYLRNNLAIQDVADYIQSNMPKPEDIEELARERYKANLEKYKVPESAEASHILLKSNNGKSDEQLLEEIVAIRKKILLGVLTFEEAAVEYSEDPGSKERAGLLGRFTRGRMIKEFEDAAFSLDKPGEISDPVKTKFGYHLIRLSGKFSANTKTFEQVKSELVDEIQKETATRLREDYWLAIRDDPNVRLNEDAIREFLQGSALESGQQ